MLGFEDCYFCCLLEITNRQLVEILVFEDAEMAITHPVAIYCYQ